MNEDMKEEAEDSEEDLHNRRQMMQGLLKAPGWGELDRIVTEQIEQRKVAELAYDIKGSEDLYELVRLKAERRALMLVLSLPETIVETITEDLKEIEDAAGE